MTYPSTEKLLKLLKAYGVTHFKSLEIEIQMDLGKAPTVDGATVPRGAINHAVSQWGYQQASQTPPSTSASAPPVEMEIPHHVNEVAKLLKLSDEDLVDRLFPDHTLNQDD